MTHRATRVFLAIVAFTAAAGGAYLLHMLDTRQHALRAAAVIYDDETERALLLIERLRAAQQSYLAEGQGTQFWMGRASETLDGLERSLTTLGGTAPASDMREGARASAQTLEELRRLDARAREWIRAGDRLMASDLIFTESLAASGTLAAATAALKDRHRQHVQRELADARQQQLYAVSGAAVVLLVVVLLLTPAVRAVTPRDTREALRALMTDHAPAGSAALRAEPATRAAAAPQTAGAGAAAAAVAPQAVRPAGADTPLQPPVKPRLVDVPAAARVCSELARVIDPAVLPGVLEQAAGLLGANGLIVWVGDRRGQLLYPMLSHGYGPAALAQMGSLHRDDDNATAAAYRRGESAVVPARRGSAGAIVTPIVSPDGCVGVLTAEVRDGAEADGERRALAGILAAQLATLVTALPSVDRAVQAQG